MKKKYEHKDRVSKQKSRRTVGIESIKTEKNQTLDYINQPNDFKPNAILLDANGRLIRDLI